MNNTSLIQIIDALGGTRAVAVAANVHQVTVERWRKRNLIPRKYHAILAPLASKKGVSLPTNN
jgi:hypothetical protein